MRISGHTALNLESARPSSARALTSLPGSSGNVFGGILETLRNKSTASTTAATTANTATVPATTSSTSTTAASTIAASATASTAASTSATQTPGLQALVNAIINGSLKATYVTDPSQLQQTAPNGQTAEMPNAYYASNQTAQQIAQLLGGTVVQQPPFGVDPGSTEPNANFIELPNGMTVNAADLAYYTRCGGVGAAQLTADLTQTINAGAAWTNYYQHGGPMPLFPTGYVGPPVSGMYYPAGSIGSDGNVINPGQLPPSA